MKGKKLWLGADFGDAEESIIKGEQQGCKSVTSSYQTDWLGGKGRKFPQNCYSSHPVLKTPQGLLIYGGNCRTPVVKDAQVYIGFANGATGYKASWPWAGGHVVDFPIQDMFPPSDAEDFRKLVLWTRDQMIAGKKVHAGCVGGHGRTGILLSALVALEGEKNAIQYVREKYCKEAVESKEQVDFLMKEYGCATVEAVKKWSAISSGTAPKYVEGNTQRFSDVKETAYPVAKKWSLWGGRRP